MERGLGKDLTFLAQVVVVSNFVVKGENLMIKHNTFET